jgi:hypothetical protein
VAVARKKLHRIPLHTRDPHEAKARFPDALRQWESQKAEWQRLANRVELTPDAARAIAVRWLETIAPKAELSAKAVAKASYERKRTITEVIPEDVTREKNSAFLDIIVPVRRFLGAKGDILAHRRALQQMRFEQEKAALAAIGRQFTAALSHGVKPTPPPLKFLTHFVDKAGLEEPDSPLFALWGNLLASTSEKYDDRYIHLVIIISNVSPKQALIFKKVFRAEIMPDLRYEIEKVAYDFYLAGRRE